MELYIVVAASALSALVWHHFLDRFLIAVAGSTAVTVIIFQILAYIEISDYDPFFLVGIFISGFVAMAVSVVIGVPYFFHRKKKRNGFPKKEQGVN